MNSFVSYVTVLVLVASVDGGTQRFVRQTGWGAPPPPSGGLPININMSGISEAIGEGIALANHDVALSVVGSAANPAIANVGTGSGTSLNQNVYNYQQSVIGSDGSSAAYQGNSGSNDGSAYEYLGANAVGDLIYVNSNGDSGIAGVGISVQADSLNHTGGKQYQN